MCVFSMHADNFVMCPSPTCNYSQPLTTHLSNYSLEVTMHAASCWSPLTFASIASITKVLLQIPVNLIAKVMVHKSWVIGLGTYGIENYETTSC